MKNKRSISLKRAAWLHFLIGGLLLQAVFIVLAGLVISLIPISDFFIEPLNTLISLGAVVLSVLGSAWFLKSRYTLSAPDDIAVYSSLINYWTTLLLSLVLLLGWLLLGGRDSIPAFDLLAAIQWVLVSISLLIVFYLLSKRWLRTT